MEKFQYSSRKLENVEYLSNQNSVLIQKNYTPATNIGMVWRGPNPAQDFSKRGETKSKRGEPKSKHGADSLYID
jgi:hypothetical protein